MAVNPQGFVTPEQDFKGLYNLSNNLEQKKLRDEELQRQRQGKKSASDKYFTNYLDPKDRFTGTKFDPEVNKLLGEALKQAYDLSSTGADDTEIFTAISPIVNKVNDYSQKAMAVNAQKKQAVEFLKGQKGIDINKFSTAFDDAVFNEVDGSGNKRMRDISQIDPNYNYIDQVLKDGDIYNAEGFDDYVSKSGKNTTVEDVSVYNKDKSMRRTKAEMTMPSFMVSEKDERGAHTGFVPQYDIATDGEQPVLHDFLNEEGVTESAPVRLVTQDVFNSLPPNTKAYLRQEAKKYAKEKKIDISSPQVENFAKALAYDELKRSAKQYSTLKEVQVQKAAPTVIHNTTNVNTGSGSGSKIKGNVMDGMQDADLGFMKIEGGKFFNQDGTPFSGETEISGANIPATMKSVLKSGGVDPLFLMQGIKAKIKDGVMVSISNEQIGSVSREDMEGIYQPKFDTERRGESLVFPNTKPKADTQKQEGGMVTVILKDGRKGQIPSDKVAQFLKDNPGAKKQ